MASGALALRGACDATELPSFPDDHPLWDYSAYYIAQLCVTLVLIASPEHITLGGGIFNRKSLYAKIRTYVQALMNGYIQNDHLTTDKIDQYITPSFW